MILHANAIPENRSACIRTRGIDGDDSNRSILLAIVLGQLIHERTLARAGRTSEAQNPRMSAAWKQSLQKLRRSRRTVFDHADSARQTPRIAGTQAINQWLEVGSQTVSVKQGWHKQKRRAAFG